MNPVRAGCLEGGQLLQADRAVPPGAAGACGGFDALEGGMDRGAVHASARQVASTSPTGDLLLETRGLTKVFGALRASDGVDLQVRAGEIHAILGENGAGKSTLMKMLYGYYQPTSGEIRVRGQPVRLTSPHAGRAQGIGMVFQAFTLIPAMEVWENVALFLDGRACGLVSRTGWPRTRISPEVGW